MHYIGMTALHASAHLHHQPFYVAGSGLTAIATCGVALWLAGGRGGRPPLLLSATALGIAIAGMHYTAMAGVTLVPHAAPPTSAPALSSDLLAIVVAIVAFVVSGLFLLILVPERAAEATRARPEPVTTPPVRLVPISAEPVPRRPARHLPIERDGLTQFVAVDDVVAVHANAHYTYIFDGSARLFCPLAISDVEARLDTTRFIRVHRSHIVNVDRIVGLKRAGDNGLIELKAADRYTVPISRSRVGSLKSRLAPKLDPLPTPNA
jgi:DNA-binding LytR/AlgR family response regulator